MSATPRYLTITLLAVAVAGTARSQGLPPPVDRPPAFPAPPPAFNQAPAGAPAMQPPALPAAPDDYLTYSGPHSCYCPIGGDGPIKTELYLRAGPDFPVGGGVYSRMLQTGWEIQGGGRALFFVPD